MADDNLERQVDEIEALSSIYEDQWLVEDATTRKYKIEITDGHDKPKLSLTLQVQLPLDYPSAAPPRYELNAPWMRGQERIELCNQLETIYLDNLGESLIYLWVEHIRDYLSNRDENLIQWTQESTKAPVDTQDKNSEGHEISTDPDQLLGDQQEVDYDDSFDPSLIDKMATCAVAPEADEDEVLTCPEIHDSGLLRDRKSVFQAHLARVTHPTHVKLVMEKLLENRKIAEATHNIQAYRISLEKKGRPIAYQGCVDDGEIHAGSRMLHLLQIIDADNVLVVVTRWYGGVHLGPDRFKHINNLTRQILFDHGYIKGKEDKKGPKSGKKGRKGQGTS